jgi:hypothetical protein
LYGKIEDIGGRLKILREIEDIAGDRRYCGR